jgi:hypothetical protein
VHTDHFLFRGFGRNTFLFEAFSVAYMFFEVCVHKEIVNSGLSSFMFVCGL